MVDDINTVNLSGNLTRDAELVVTNSGTSILNFPLAINASKKVRGEWEKDTYFIDCVLFGSRAEGLSSHLSKGMKVMIEGRLEQQRWHQQDGSKRSKFVVIVNNIVLAPKYANPGPPKTDEAPGDGYAPSRTEIMQEMGEEFYKANYLENDIPF